MVSSRRLFQCACQMAWILNAGTNIHCLDGLDSHQLVANAREIKRLVDVRQVDDCVHLEGRVVAIAV